MKAPKHLKEKYGVDVIDVAFERFVEQGEVQWSVTNPVNDDYIGKVLKENDEGDIKFWCFTMIGKGIPFFQTLKEAKDFFIENAISFNLHKQR